MDKNTRTFEGYQPEVMNMYPIYTLLTIMALLFGITIWASIPEEEEDRRS